MALFRRLLFDRHRVLVKWLISYISILLVPVLISFFMYMESESILEIEINRANNVLLKQVQEITDGHLQEIERLSQSISWNPRVQELMYVESPLQDINYFSIYKIMQEFKLYSISNGFIDDFYVYYKSCDLAISTKYSLSGEEFYKTVHKTENMTYEQWVDMINDRHTKDFMSIERITEDGKVHKSIAYIRSLPIENPSQDSATLVILVDEAKYLQAIKNIQLVNKGNVLLLDSTNNVLTSTMPLSKRIALKYEDLQKDTDIIYEKVKNENMAISYKKSNVTDWKFVSLIPSGIFWEKAVYIKRLTIMSFVLSILLGGIMTYFNLRKNYNPINKLIQSIVKKAGLKFNKGYNEYDFIHDALSTTLSEKKKMDGRLKQQNIMLRSNFLVRMMKGEYWNEVPLNEALSSFDIVFDSEYFAVMLFYIDDFEELFADEKEIAFEEKLKLVQFIMTNIIEELVGRKNQGYMMEIDNMMACLVNLQGVGNDSRDDLLQIANEAMQIINDKFHISFKVSISNIHKTVSHISMAYQEALNIMEYKIIMGSDEVLCCDDIKESPQNYYYPLQLEQQLINCIKAGDFEKAQEIFEGIFRKNFVDASPSIQLAKCLMFDLGSTMVKTLDEISNVKEGNFIEELNYVDQLLSCKTVKDMKTKMIMILHSVCKYIEDKKKNDNNELSSKIISYINDNYQNVNLNINMVGEVFELTPAYLSKIFKDQTGEPLLDFINNIRLKKAKQLLKEQKLNINEAAELSGYNDVNTFIRIFKKYEGITPGRYKENEVQ